MGVDAAKVSPGGLEAIICIAKSARVMLISNLWVDNGAIGTVKDHLICHYIISCHGYI